MNPSFNSRFEAQSIQLLLNNLRSKEIILDPTYQRGDVWTERMRSDFIDSILSGIIPSNVIFNKEYKDGKELLTCIDGKQRITTILWFRESKIPHIKYNDDETQIYTFFDKIPDNIDDNKDKDKDKDNRKYQTLDDKEKFMLFLDRMIPVAFYSNLPYENQVDIFTRINHSMPATNAEILLSKFSDKDAAEQLKDFFDSINFANNKIRKDNYDYIFNTMYMIHYEDLRLMGNGKIRAKNEAKFIADTNKSKIMSELINTCKDFIKIYYSNDIITNKKIKKLNLTKNFTMICLILFIISSKIMTYQNIYQIY